MFHWRWIWLMLLAGVPQVVGAQFFSLNNALFVSGFRTRRADTATVEAGAMLRMPEVQARGFVGEIAGRWNSPAERGFGRGLTLGLRLMQGYSPGYNTGPAFGGTAPMLLITKEWRLSERNRLESLISTPSYMVFYNWNGEENFQDPIVVLPNFGLRFRRPSWEVALMGYSRLEAFPFEARQDASVALWDTWHREARVRFFRSWGRPMLSAALSSGFYHATAGYDYAFGDFEVLARGGVAIAYPFGAAFGEGAVQVQFEQWNGRTIWLRYASALRDSWRADQARRFHSLGAGVEFGW